MFYISDLNKIKNILPIIYLSYDINSICKFIVLYERIRNSFPDIKIFFVIHDDIKKIFPHEFLMSNSLYQNYKRNFAKEYVLENGENMDVLEKFGFDNKIDLLICRCKNTNFRDVYYFEDKHKNKIQQKMNLNFHKINNLHDAKNESYAIAAVESPNLIYFASEGRKILLVQEDKMKNSFQKMFPDTFVVY